MPQSIETTANFAITVALGFLVLLFIVRVINQRKPAKILLLSLIIGFLAGIFSVISHELLLPLSQRQVSFFLAVHLNLYGLHFFLFYLFLERLIREQPHSFRFLTVFGLLLLQTFSLWTLVIFDRVSIVTTAFWFPADVGYNTIALFVIFGVGIPVYFHMYRYTNEQKPLIFCSALMLIGISFVISSFYDYVGFFFSTPGWLESIASVRDLFSFFGTTIFVGVYLFDIDYLYRLPHDIFLIMILTKGGIPLCTLRLKTRKPVTIKDSLLSGSVSAISTLFEEIFEAKIAVRHIQTEGGDLLIEEGDHITGLCVTEQASHFLHKAFKQYVKAFERQFSSEISKKKGAVDISDFQGASHLLKQFFPFLQVEAGSIK